MKQDFDEMVDFRIVGDWGIGKTSIINRFIENQFTNHPYAIDFKQKYVQIHDKRIKIRIWDAIGGSRFRSYTKSYYKKANILLLTFDLTLKETYENVQKYWIKELEQYKSEESWIVLVGNKCDSKKVVQASEIKKFTEEYGIRYFQVSAKQGVSVNQMFLELAEKIIQRKANSQFQEQKINLMKENQKIKKGYCEGCW